VTGGRVPLRRQRGVNDATRFAALETTLTAPQLLPGAMGAPSRSLLWQAYRPSTRSCYMSRWRSFVTFCTDRLLVPLPADAATIVGYIVYENKRKALAPNSLRKYFSTIRSIHALAGCPDPTAAHVVTLAVAGYKAVHAALVGSQSPKWLPIPAEFITHVLYLGVGTPDIELSRSCGGLVWAYLLLNRPGAAAGMRYRDLRVTAAGVHCQVPFFKGGVRRDAERIATTVPYAAGHPGDDKAICLLHRLLGDHVRNRRHPNERLFAPGYWPSSRRAADLGAGATNVWLAELAARINLRPPLGGTYSGHSLRSGAASAAYSLGFPVVVVADLCTHRSVATTLRHYISVRFRAAAEAQELLGRYRPTDLHL